MKLGQSMFIFAALGCACSAPLIPGPRSVPFGQPLSAAAQPTVPVVTPARAAAPAAANEAAEDDTQRQVRVLRRAQGLFRTFIEKAGDRPEFDDAVRRSRERIEDIEQTIAFLEQRDP